jgi:choline transport protein
MHKDSIQKASSVEVAGSRKRSHLRPIVTKGDSFFNEREESRKLDNDSAPKISISSARSRPPPTPRSAVYRPDWAQDAESAHIPQAAVDDLGSPEDLKDVLRMGITQEMRVSLSSVKA